MNHLTIKGLEGQSNTVTLQVQFNPKEIDFDRGITWGQQPNRGPSDLEYLSSSPSTMTFELVLDGIDTATSVQPSLAKLQQLADVDSDLHRPPKVKITWGSNAGGMPPFVGVIEAISMRYLFFSPNGLVLKATVRLQLKSADKVMVGHP
jgi:hypothetical protein